MQTSQRPYIGILQEEFERRTKRNPRFSLRAFARLLEFPPSGLSDLFNGKRGLSPASAERIVKALGFTKVESEYFVSLVVSREARSDVKRRAAQVKLKQILKLKRPARLQADDLSIIAKWYHLAILELTYLEDFKADPAWIAKRLGLSVFEAKQAVERLVRKKLLISVDDKLCDAHERLSTPDGVPSQVIRDFHRQILTKAAAALDEQRVEARNFSNNIFSINAEDLPRAKELINQFRTEFAKEMGKGSKKNKVYNLSIQCFELTTGDEDL